MEHDANEGSRGRTNSIAAANGCPNPKPSNDGSMSNPQVEETRSQSSVDIARTLDSSEYNTNNGRSEEGPPRNTSHGPASTSSTNKTLKSNDLQAHIFEPPVTKHTLSELDVNKIVHNPKLRHDINFDPELHFRPNLDGEKGRRKKLKAEEFWETMREQLKNYMTDCEGFERGWAGREWCLPATLEAIRGILETLVPQKDRLSVAETFSVDFLMQQFRKGVANLAELAKWLSGLLKQHCAPMRDEWVDLMVKQLTEGNEHSDVKLLVGGMCSLLAVLEAMKLDVANHQIRCLRPLLIDDTVHFEQKFFLKKIAMGRVDVAGANAWFKRAGSLPNVGPVNTTSKIQGSTWDFMKALVDLTLQPKSSEMVPHTFLFDEERLIKLRSDMLDLVNLEVCMVKFRHLEAATRFRDARSRNDTPITSYPPTPDRPASPANESLLSSPTLPSEHHFKPKAAYHDAKERGHLLTQPSGQQIWVQNPEDEIHISASPSPQSSPSTSASTPSTYPPTPLYLSLSTSDSACQARSNFQAIIAADNSSGKWAAQSSAIALQILRSTNTPLIRLPQHENHLAFHLSNPRSADYQAAEQHVLAQIFPVLQKLVETYSPMSSLQLFEAATATKPTPWVKGTGVTEEISEIATRIAHIGILHWRVWAPLAYLVDPDVVGDDQAMRVDIAP